ncbi:MAG: SpoIID/LytB domain-containing protein [Christensenellales bacterium]
MKKIKSAWISLCMLAVLVLTICMPSDVGYAASDYSFIRVLLSTPHNTEAHTITVVGSYTIKEKADYKVTAGKYTVKLNGATVQLVKDGVTTDIGTKCTFVPASYTDLGNLITVDKASSRKYLGDIIFYKNKFKTNGNLVDKLHVVNRVPMEQYLYGVIGAEIGAGSHIEALKTQAVAARCYAINQLAPSEPNYEVTDTASYQVYSGYSDNARVKQAVDETKGQVVTYNGKICVTFFGASNGGQTELPGNAFGGGSSKNAQYPYLAQKDDPYDVKNTASKSQVLYIPKQIDTVSDSGVIVKVQSRRTDVRIRRPAPLLRFWPR